ncbi:MAG TPA: DUF1326 domain-containing protein, partial [Terriglobia bacterium]|nr:DUF1326 domain-containing protein [Terriglobia bacterium]
MKRLLWGGIGTLITMAIWAIPSSASVQGNYVEVRTADVYTGPCFANAQVGLEGRRAILAWNIKNGQWRGVNLSGLNVLAVVRAKDNLGDPYHNPYPAKTVVIVDQRASAAQRAALISFVRAAGGLLTKNIVQVDAAPITVAFGSGMNHGQVSVVAGKLARIQTRGLCNGDVICGNEELYYPPLTKV